MGQVIDQLDCKDPTLVKYLNLVLKLQEQFETLHINEVPRDDNMRADKLSKGSLQSAIDTLANPSIDSIHAITTTDGRDWRF